MWERPWTDSRDGKVWLVRTGQGNPGMGISREAEADLREAPPPPGRDWISFRNDDDPAVYSTGNPGGRTVGEFTDGELQELLDNAKAEKAASKTQAGPHTIEKIKEWWKRSPPPDDQEQPRQESKNLDEPEPRVES